MDSQPPKPRLREQFHAVMRAHHYSIRTEKSYWYWIRFYLRFHQMRHPLELGPAEVNQFLSWLASERHVAAATQNLALNAIVFLYARVLERPLGDIGETIRAKRPPRLPVVLSHQEALAVIGRLAPPYDLLASLMYGAGLRVVEAARLRVKDIDFDKQVIIVRDGKGGKDRTTLLPASLTARLTERIALIRAAAGAGGVLPGAGDGAPRTQTQVPQRFRFAAMAMAVSLRRGMHGCGRRPGSSSRACQLHSACHQAGGAGLWVGQAGEFPHLSAYLCYRAAAPGQ